MSKTTLKRLTIPTAGDDLLNSWQRFADSCGVIVAADSVPAARIVLQKMADAQINISSSSPVYFDIGGVIYRADGRRSAQTWILSPVNEVEYAETTYSGNWNSHLAAGDSSGMMSLNIPARPYDRLFILDANIYGHAVTGNVDMALKLGERVKLSRIASGEAHSVSATLQGVVRAGVKPQIAVAIRGGSGGGRAGLATDNRFNTLSATAFPITMS